jgi:hypothetical protein
MPRKTIFEYEVNDRGALRAAEKIARAIVQEHPELSYRIISEPGEGAYVKLYGPHEDLVESIAESFNEETLELLLAGTPVYIIYAGKKPPE